MRSVNLKQGVEGNKGTVFEHEKFLEGGGEYSISIVMVAEARGSGFDSTGSTAEMIQN